ncbi:type II secretion system major pseudopilin GspG [Marinicella sp. S1101]|uniref:type II secretion system major pseudopilin GspG n=1 Tax=Marinicella marina TaxID=2996016 RepID=UPI002260D1B0|nr:type II secretion system major pseudopilin GspG [Marinicella marina]MCX7554767.1 type II secretion system major pseudopilin GspG [Marinicella marina]MDJ1141000.1 type II secretion system major pseudopilin GspG [Marinicella marina]
MKTYKNTSTSSRHQVGFTLMEILIVVVILSILAVTVVPQFLDAPDKARVSRAQADIKNLETSLGMYKMDNFNYPSTSQGLQALVQKPSGTPEAKNWKPGGYVAKLPEDPWGNPYQYLNPGNRAVIDIYSFGADGQPGGEGLDADLGNW